MFLLYPPRKKNEKTEKKTKKNENKAKKCENNAKKREKNDKYAQLHFFAFLFALPFVFFLLCFCFIKLFWLLVSMAGVPDISIAGEDMIGKEVGSSLGKREGRCSAAREMCVSRDY